METPSADTLERYRAGALMGWISIGAWIIVYTPQIYENYTLKSGDGLSVAFILIWAAGDVTGLIAALAQNLMPTLAVLAAYYAVCDAVLLLQVYWYRRRRRLYPELYVPIDVVPGVPEDESTPLIAGGKVEHRHGRLRRYARTLFVLLAGIAFILIFGFAAWSVTMNPGRGRHPRHPRIPIEEWDTGAQVVGWISAALYLGSRIPQILKNRETHCAGLSPIFIFFSVCGNVTYGASILIPSTSWEHIYINSSFLVGSLGTIALDLTIIAQFWIYRSARKNILIDCSASESGDL